MIIHELSRAECEEFLRHHHLARLACARHDQPYIVPISYAFDSEEQCLHGFSTRGKKVEWMRANPRVCVAIDDIVDQSRWTSVIITGRYKELGHTTAADKRSLLRAQELFQQRAEWWLPAAGHLSSGEEHATPVFYRIRVDSISGRRAGPAT
jgi:nitroimidazol reductase NimA-like FMN-containing flavoprotein (pyridoxamine 5'-phosphate oxidase superfamily)